MSADITATTTLRELADVLHALGATMEVDRKKLRGYCVTVYSRRKGAPEYAYKSRATYGNNKLLHKAIAEAIDEHRKDQP